MITLQRYIKLHAHFLKEIQLPITSIEQQKITIGSRSFTSYVRVPPEEPGWRKVTLEIAPLAESMQMERGPFWENDSILVATSCKQEREESHMTPRMKATLKYTLCQSS